MTPQAKASTQGGLVVDRATDDPLTDLADRVQAMLARRGPQSHQALAAALASTVTLVNAAVTLYPQRFRKLRLAHGRLRQTETFVALAAPVEQVA